MCVVVLGVNQWQQQLQSREGIGPGVAQGDGTVFRQVLLPQEDVQAEHPWVLHTLGKNPHVAGALHVIRTAHQASRPLHQPLEVNMVAERQGGLGKKDTQQQNNSSAPLLGCDIIPHLMH